MVTAMRASPLKALAAAAVLSAGAASGLAFPGHVQAAGGYLAFVSSSTWTANPDARTVHVSTHITATSHALDTTARRYFYDQVIISAPPAAQAFVAASQGGQPLAATVKSRSVSGVVVAVSLGQQLYQGDSTTLSLDFDLVDDGGSTDRDLRISRNVMSFPVWAFGSPGTPGSTVTVIFPVGFSVQEEFGGLARSLEGSGLIVYSSGRIDDSTTLSAWFTAVQPVAATDFRTRTLTVGPLAVSLHYWYDDPGWADRVQSVLAQGYPVLRSLIGLGDPALASLSVTEASTEEIGGFAGSFDAAGGQVEVSYFADPFVILHEAAHMWFNASLASDRWIDEGFASWYAEQAVIRLGMVDHAPVLSSSLLQAAVPLNDWVAPGGPSSATAAYLYAASLVVARQIAVLARQDGLSLVWAAAQTSRAAYQPLHEPEVQTGPGTLDWERFLDLLQGITGGQYEAIWRQWVVDDTQAPLLAQRAQARAAFTALEPQLGSWDTPPDVRAALELWQFDRAQTLMTQAREVLERRDRIDAAASAEQATPPGTLQTLFEQTGVSAADAEAASELAALDAITAARQAEVASRGGAGALGLIGADPAADLQSALGAFSSGDMGRARSFANSAEAAWAGAGSAGQVRLFGSLAIVGGLLLLVVVAAWTRGRGPGARRHDRALGLVGAGGLPAGLSVPAGMTAAAGPGSPGDPGPGGRDSGGDAAGGGAAGGEARDGSGGDEATRPPGRGGRSGPGVSGGGETGGESQDVGQGEPPAAGAESPHESAYELLQRGHALLADRHHAQAAVVLERAARAEPGKGSILEALARAYFNSGQHGRAAEAFAALLEIDPSAHYGHFGLGLSFARLGRPREARTHLRLAVALDPGSATYRRALARVEARGS